MIQNSTNADVPRILILDSGIGGLSITQHIRQLCPFAQIEYLADLAFFPYGEKESRMLIPHVCQLIEQSMKRCLADVIVIACNTASTSVLDAVRDCVSVPVVGVVPAIKPAAQLSGTGAIGILATEATVNSAYTGKLIADFAAGHQVALYGSRKLVAFAEAKLRGEPLSSAEIESELDKLIRQNSAMDTIVLACTHFPILLPEFKRVLPHIRHWVDSGEAIARRVQHWLASLGFASPLRSPPQPSKNLLSFTGENRPNYQAPKISEYLGEFESKGATD